MVGIVGYVRGSGAVPPRTIDVMAEDLVHLPSHKKEVYHGSVLDVGRVHLGIFNREPQPVFGSGKTSGIVGEGMVYYADPGPPSKQAGVGYSTGWLGRVLASFQDKGAQALTELNGSFSFVIFDEADEAVHLVGDRFGTRPLHYWTKGKELAFATEAKAILDYPLYSKKLNPEAPKKFFRYGRLGIWGNETWFEGIQVLPPGSVLTWREGRTDIVQYWDVNYREDGDAGEDAMSERLAAAFRRAVALRTRDKTLRYSVGLSGGLDSRAVLAACAGREDITTYTFGIRGFYELAIAGRVARAARAPHMVCAFTPEEETKFVEEVIELSDGAELIGLSFIVLADKKFQGSVDVALDGIALELLSGNFVATKATPLTEKIIDAKSPSQLAEVLEHKWAVFGKEELRLLLYPEFVGTGEQSVEAAFLRMVSQSKGSTMPDKADYFAIKTRERFLNMGHVLTRNYFEDSVPALDNGFIDVITRIPVEMRYHHRVYRKFLRSLSRELSDIPYTRTGLSPNRGETMWLIGTVLTSAPNRASRTLARASRGRIVLPTPMGYVDFSASLRRSACWRDLMGRTVANKNSLMYEYNIVRKDYVDRLVRDHMNGRRDNRERIHYLITFELTLRRFFSDGIGERR